jgi:hypothetical protein
MVARTPLTFLYPALSVLVTTALNEDMSRASRSDTFTAGKGFSISVEKEAERLHSQSGHIVENKSLFVLVIKKTKIPCLFSHVTILTLLILLNLLRSDITRRYTWGLLYR